MPSGRRHMLSERRHALRASPCPPGVAMLSERRRALQGVGGWDPYGGTKAEASNPRRRRWVGPSEKPKKDFLNGVLLCRTQRRSLRSRNVVPRSSFAHY